MKPSKTITVYDEMVEDYVQVVSDWDDPQLTNFIAWMPTGASVLDIGCGPGIASAAMAAAGLIVHAIDGSAEMVQRAGRHPGVTAWQATFDEIEGEAQYDGLWASFSLLHAPKAHFPKHLSTLHRAAKPGARLYLAMKIGQGEATDDLGRFYAYYTKAELDDLLVKAGFSVHSHVTGHDKGLAGTDDPWIAMTAYA